MSWGTEGRPFRREGTHNAWGVCLLVCPIYTATASRAGRAPMCRARSLSLSSFSLSLFFALARFSLSLLSLSLPRFPRISAWTSPRCIVRPLERFQPIGAPHDDFIMKKRNVRVDQTPFAICKGRCAGDGTGHAACVSRMFTVAG